MHPVMGEREILMSSNDCLEFEKDLLLIKNFGQLVELIGLECIELHKDYVIYRSSTYGIDYTTPRSPEFVENVFRTLNALTPIPGQEDIDLTVLILVWEALCSPQERNPSFQQDYLFLKDHLGLELLKSDDKYLYYWLKKMKRKRKISKDGETGLRLAHLVLKKLNNIYDGIE